MSRHVRRVVHVIHELEPEFLAPFLVVFHRSQIIDAVALVNLPTATKQACFVAIAPRGKLGEGAREKVRLVDARASTGLASRRGATGNARNQMAHVLL